MLYSSLHKIRSNLLDRNALLLRVTGLIALLNVPFRHLPNRFEDVVGFELSNTTRYTSLVLGIVLLYLASQIAHKKRTAYYVAVVAISLLLVLEMVHYREIFVIVLYGGTLLSLISTRHQYVVRSDLVTFRRASLAALGTLLGLVLFVGVSIQVINRHNFGSDVSAKGIADILARAMIGLPLPDYVHLSHFGQHIVRLLHLATISSLIVIGISLFQPLRLRRYPSRSQRHLAEQITQRYSRSSEDYFKLWPEDKHYFFYRESFIAYGLWAGVALVLDGATGKPNDCPGLRQAFLNEAELNGWTTAVVHADQDELTAWQSLGLQALFIGSEAMVNVAEFETTTVRSKHFRYVRNKAAKDGLQSDYWQAPLTDSQVAELRVVSDAWLNYGGHREYRFTMGYFDDSNLRRCDVAVLRQNDHVVAYANLIPTYVAETASIDHMRIMPDISTVAMHALLMDCITRLAARQVVWFNLGLAPLSRLQEQTDLGLSKKLLGMLRTFSSRYYSTSGLEQFKGKFQPEWQPRYLLYSGSPARLSTIATALTAVTTFRASKFIDQSDSRPLITASRSGRESPWRDRLLFTGIAIAALGYSAFPLAYFFNRPYVWQGLVSELAEFGQPYSWLFNGLDAAGGVAGCLVFGYLLLRLARGRGRTIVSTVYRTALLLAFVASIGDLITTFIALPDGYDTTKTIILNQILAEPTVLLHGITSFLNSAAFVVSLGLWTYALRREHGKKVGIIATEIRVWMFLLAVSIGTFGSYIGLEYPSASASLQRVFILLYSTWLVMLGSDAVRRLRTMKSIAPAIDNQ